MKFSLYAPNVELAELDRQQLEKKLERLEKHLHPPFTFDISLAHDTHHSKGQVLTCKINIEEGKRVFHAERAAGTIQDALDETLLAIRQELDKQHSKNQRNRWNIKRWLGR